MSPRYLSHKIFIFLLSIFFITQAYRANAQYFTVGTNPASVKWEYFQTEHFSFIFPRTYADKADYLANAMEYIYGPGSASLNSHPPKTPLILHNLSVNSNAFTPYAPRRMEFITVPDQHTYAQNWMDQLVLHEFRHAAQFAALNQGFTRGLSWIFGQQAVPAMIALFVPLWFVEGDAVGQETALCRTGRGRSPSFYQHLRAQFVDKKIYTYGKAVNGSYRDFIPDRYELGYQLVGLTRVNYGLEVWSNVLRNVARKPFTLVPFSHSLKKQTGFGKYKLYDTLTSQLQKQWEGMDKRTALTPLDTISPASGKNYTSYNLPCPMPDGSVIAVKSSMDDIKKVVRIFPDSTEKVLFTAGVNFPIESLSAGGALVCWPERLRDPRWNLREYSVIFTYNLKTGKKKQITHKSRYFSPAISPDGTRIAVVKVSLDNHYSIVILDANSGDSLNTFTTPENYYFIQPTWTPDGMNLVSVILGNYGKSIIWIDLAKSSSRYLMPYTASDISRPFVFEHYIMYTGPYSGVDNIFALDTLSGKTYRVVSSRFGATQGKMPARSKNLYYADYTANGYQLAKTDLDPANWTGPVPTGNFSTPLADSLSALEEFKYKIKNIPAREHEKKKYHKGLNLFDFHSWAPLSFDLNNYNINPGVMLLSQNLLSSSYTTLGWEYDMNEETGKYYLNYSYEGWYPTISLNTDYGLRRSVYISKEKDTIPYKWNELNLQLKLGIPLNWYCGAWFLGVQPSIASSYKNMQMAKGSELKFNHDHVQTMDYDLYAYTQYKKSIRDIYPVWGQQLELTYRDTPFDGSNGNSLFAAQAVLYFPGIIHHQGLKLYAGYQNRRSDYYGFGNQVAMPRGYTGLYPDKAISLSGTYAFPVAYPDWDLGNILFLKRINGAVFYDHLIDNSTPSSAYYNSVGLDLTVDIHVLSFLAPFHLGLRNIYLPKDASYQARFIFSIDIGSIY